MAKKHGHEAKHAHCEHCLHACDHCEVAYCCDCNKEWGTCRRQHDSYWPYTYPYWTTTIPCDITTTAGDFISSGTTTNLDLTNTNYTIDHAHAHVN